MNKLKFIIYMLMLFCIVYSIKITSAYFEQKSYSETLNQTINDLHQEVESYEIRLDDSTAIWVARVSDLNMTISNIRSYYDKILTSNKIKPSDVNHITSTETFTHSVETLRLYVDSFGGMKTSYVDPYTHIDINIDSTKTAIIDYSIKDSLTIINYQKKHRLFWGLIKWNENLKTIVVSKNPKTTIVNVESINNIEK